MLECFLILICIPFFNNFNVISNDFGNLNKKDFEIILSDNKNNFDTITGKYFFTQEYPALSTGTIYETLFLYQI